MLSAGKKKKARSSAEYPWCASDISFSSPGLAVRRSFGDASEEFHRASAVFQIGVRHGFRAPQPISLDETRGHETISFEWIDLDAPLRDFLSEADLGLHRAAGVALAQLHRELIPRGGTGGHHIYAPVHLRNLDAGPGVYCHGDYTLGNVWAHREGGLIVVMDPFPNSYSSHQLWQFASPYYDLSTYIGGLAGRVPQKYFYGYQRRTAAKLGNAFIQGYEITSGRVIDIEALEAFSTDIAISYASRLTVNSSWNAFSMLQAYKLSARLFFKHLAFERKHPDE
jgi:hypothetical protein